MDSLHARDHAHFPEAGYVIGMKVLAVLDAPPPVVVSRKSREGSFHDIQALLIGPIPDGMDGKLKAESLAVKGQVGDRQFAEDLRVWASEIQNFGIARDDDPAPGQVALEVKITFADRDEIQRWVLLSKADGWAVTSMSTAVTQEQEIPFGMPVFGTTDREQ